MKFPLPYAFARESQLLLEDDGASLTLMTNKASSRGAMSEVLRKFPVRAIEAMTDDALVQRISAAYSQGESSAALVASEVESDADLGRMMQELPAVEDLLEAADDAPIIRLVNSLLQHAVKERASDIHVEPFEREIRVRFRIDDLLYEIREDIPVLIVELAKPLSARPVAE